MDEQRALAEMTCEEIQAAVRAEYSRVADQPEGGFPFPVGRAFAESVGYPAEVLDRLPPAFAETFTGAGNPQAFVDVKEGETLLDVGCGAGLDLWFYGQKVGATGALYGLDFSSSMIETARANLGAAGVDNVTLLTAPAESIPLPDNSVDIVTSNGIYNLSPDKAAVLREVHRVVRPGGRTIFSEIVLKAPLEESAKKLRDWFKCIGGALVMEDLLPLMAEIGFEEPTVLDLRRHARTGHELSICATIRALQPAA
jgi:SAM-dependent methyltransferase